MLRCANGHANPETALFCATCKAVMPPVPRDPDPPIICWRVDPGEPATAAPPKLDEVFEPGDEPAPLAPTTQLRRRRRWRHRRVSSS